MSKKKKDAEKKEKETLETESTELKDQVEVESQSETSNQTDMEVGLQSQVEKLEQELRKKDLLIDLLCEQVACCKEE